MTEMADSQGIGLFKVCAESKLYVRSSSFHPIDPVQACGLYSGEVVILRGPNHSARLSPSWTIERQFQYESSALSLEWNMTGTKLAAGCSDGTVVVWCYPTGEKQIFELNGPSNCSIIVWNPLNCDVLASFNKSADCKLVLICEAATDRSYELKSNQNVSCVDWISRNRLVCGYDKGTAEIHEIELNDKLTIKLVKKLFVSAKISHSSDPYSLSEGDVGYNVSSVVWNEELQLLASSSKDSWIKIWSMDKEDPIRVMQSSSSCSDLVWSPSSGNEIIEKPFLAGGLENGSILIWSPLYKIPEKFPSLFFDGHSHELYKVLFSPNGRFLASTDTVGKLVIWSTKNWEIIYTLHLSGSHHPCTISWEATSSKLAISETNGQKPLTIIEHVFPESCCATCQKPSQDLKCCSRCHSIKYCSKECQRLHWPQHKTDCHKK